MTTIHTNSTSPAHRITLSPSHVLAWVGLTGILTIATARCLIAFAPQIAFDTDPAFDDSLFLGMAPAGSMTLDALLLLACAIALIGEWLSSRGVNWFFMLLALFPAPVVLYHGWNDAGDIWLGSTMLAAAVACATIAHLARDPSMRAIVIAVLVASTIPVFARGFVQVAHEHPQTVRFYEEHKEEFLRDRGWSADSPAARIYDRRLKQPQPTGWFATSNVLASLATFACVLSAGLAFAAIAARMQSGWGGSMILCAVLAGAMVWLSGSKGAALAAIAGLALLIVDLALSRRDHSMKHLPFAAIALIALAIVGVLVRGVLLPEDFAGDRSLLFRWHYWIAAARMFMENPLAGVGPDGFQAAYMVLRVPRNPEEVTSAHSVFIDWMTMLGLCGAAWIGMTFMLLGRAGRGLDSVDQLPSATGSGRSHILKNVRMSSSQQTVQHSAPAARIATTVPLIVLALGILPAHVFEWPAIDGVGLVGRLLGAAGFVCVAIIAHGIMVGAAATIAGWALLAAVTALLVHGQIEMTFVQPGAMVWAMCAVGAVARPASLQRRNRTVTPAMCSAVILVFIGALSVRAIGPAFVQQSKMSQAIALLRPIADDRDNVELMLRQRRAAASTLVDAYEAWPANVHPLHAAATQLHLACLHPKGPQPIGVLLEASKLIERAVREHGKGSSHAIAVDIYVQLAAQTADREHWNRAVQLAQRLANDDPHGIAAWRRLGDVLWAAGERASAADAYRRTLQNNANFELDSDKQLLPAQRAVIENRIKLAEDQGV